MNLGLYTATYNITQSATYTVVITVGGVQIGTPPSSLLVSPAPLNVPNSLATGGSTTVGQAGAVGAFTVQQRDVFGNSIKDYSQVTQFQFAMILPPNGGAAATSSSQNGDGSYSLTYNTTVAGTYTTTITINNVNILGSPFSTTINPAPFDPHGTNTNGIETSVTAGDLNQFSVQLRDVYGNAITDNVVPPSSIVLLFNGVAIEATVVSSGEGMYEVSYNYTTSGVYSMNVTIGGVEIGTTALPNVAVMPAGVYAPLCTAEGAATMKGYLNRENTFDLIVRDRFNNTRNGSNITPVVILAATGEATVSGSVLLQPATGAYQVSYVIGAKATYKMSVTFDGNHIQGSPFSVEAQYSNDAPNTMMIVGIVVGVVAFVALAAFFGYRLYKRRHSGYDYLA